jgi:putative DNA primase/helicase
VILPPSANAEGKRYTWMTAPGETELAIAPTELLNCIAEVGRWSKRAPGLAATPGSRQLASQRNCEGLATDLSAPLVSEVIENYCKVAFEAEVEDVAHAGRGDRNNRLNLAALRLGGLLHVGVFCADDVRKELEAAAERSGLAKEDGLRAVHATIESGLGSGLRNPQDLDAIRKAAAKRAKRLSGRAGAATRNLDGIPRAVGDDEGLPTNGDVLGRGSRDGSSPEDSGDEERRQRGLDASLAFYPQTDLGNTERFTERMRGRLLHCYAFGWLWWDERRWSADDAETKVRRAEHDTVRAIQHEAVWLSQSGRDRVAEERKAIGLRRKNVKGQIPIMSDKLAQFGRSPEAKSRMRIAENASAYLTIEPSKLNADPYKINCLNGTLSISRKSDGEVVVALGPHDPNDFITKLVPVVYDPEARCPEYDAFLEMVQPDPAMRRFLDQWGGYSLCGDTSEQIMTFHHGRGKNGKSTLFNLWGHIAGDYGKSLRIETFLDQGRATSGGAATPDLAMLKSVRYLRTSEPERGVKLAEALIKLATGGEPINVRHLNREFFELSPIFKLTMSGNYKPTIIGTDEGIWRRVRLVPWDVTIPAEKRIKDFDRVKLYPELSGIFNRLIAGLVDWMENGLIEPERVKEATEQYRSDSDPLARMLAACTIPGDATSDRIQATALHSLYRAWARANGEREWSPQGLGRAMRERGYKSLKSDVSWWIGIKAVRTEGDFVDGDGKPLVVGEPPDHVDPNDDDVVPL